MIEDREEEWQVTLAYVRSKYFYEFNNVQDESVIVASKHVPRNVIIINAFYESRIFSKIIKKWI